MSKSIKMEKGKNNIRVAKLPPVELAIRVSIYYGNADDARYIITTAMTEGYQNNELIITYSPTENVFIVTSSNPEYDYLSEMYVPDKYPGMIDKLHSISPVQYRFFGGKSFTKSELDIISSCKSDDDPISKLINKMVKEMMLRNAYNYSI